MSLLAIQNRRKKQKNDNVGKVNHTRSKTKSYESSTSLPRMGSVQKKNIKKLKRILIQEWSSKRVKTV